MSGALVAFMACVAVVWIAVCLTIPAPRGKRLTHAEAAALAADISALMQESAKAMGDMAEAHEKLLADQARLREHAKQATESQLRALNREVILQAEVERLRGLLTRLLDADHDLAVQTGTEELLGPGRFMCVPAGDWNRHADIVREVRSAMT